MPERTKWNLIDLSSGGEALSLFLLATLHRHLRSSSLRYFNPRPQSENRMPTGTNIRNELYEYVLFLKSTQTSYSAQSDLLIMCVIKTSASCELRVASYELLFKKIKLQVASCELHDKKIKVASCELQSAL